MHFREQTGGDTCHNAPRPHPSARHPRLFERLRPMHSLLLNLPHRGRVDATMTRMTQNARALLMAIGAVGLVLVIGGFAYEMTQSVKWTNCTSRYEDAAAALRVCDKTGGAGWLPLAIGVLLLIGVVVAWITLKRNAPDARTDGHA